MAFKPDRGDFSGAQVSKIPNTGLGGQLGPTPLLTVCCGLRIQGDSVTMAISMRGQNDGEDLTLWTLTRAGAVPSPHLSAP